MSYNFFVYVVMPYRVGNDKILADNKIGACDYCGCYVEYRPDGPAWAKREAAGNKVLMVCVGCAIRMRDGDPNA